MFTPPGLKAGAVLAKACAQDAVDAALSFGSVMLSPPCTGGARAWPVFRFGYVATSGAHTAASGHRATTASRRFLARHHPRSRGDPSHRGSGELPLLRARLDCRIV